MASRRKGPQAAPAQHADEQSAALQIAPPACMMMPVGEPARCPEPLHVVAVVEAAPRVGGIGLGADAAAAHAGIERLGPHLHQGERFGGGKPGRGAGHVDGMDQD